MPIEELAQAVRLVHRGYTQLGPGLMEKMIAYRPESSAVNSQPQQQEITHLTPREHDVLRLIGGGAPNREIAEKLYITEGTVKTHVTHLLNRLNLKNRSQLAIYANAIYLAKQY